MNLSTSRRGLAYVLPVLHERMTMHLWTKRVSIDLRNRRFISGLLLHSGRDLSGQGRVKRTVAPIEL